MTNIIKHSNLTPISFENKDEILTGSQLIIFNLIKFKLKEGKAITIDDIKECYWLAFSKDDKILIRGNMNSAYGNFWHEHVGITHPMVRTRAVAWFKSNLAGCIIKGKILAIPVIEINENEDKPPPGVSPE